MTPTKSDTLTPRKKPSQERSRDRVERILDATAALLGEKPLDKITTAAIAEEAGVPIGSVYQYFPNKLAVLAELARRVMEEVDVRTASLIAEDFGVLPWDEAIDKAIDATMQGYLEQPGYAQLLLSIRPTPEFRAITDESNERVAGLLARYHNPLIWIAWEWSPSTTSSSVASKSPVNIILTASTW